MNGALDEAMDIMKGSLADNSQVEQPYRTKGKIFLDENGSIVTIYIKGIIVDFETVLRSVDQNNKENKNWTRTENLVSLEWDGKERNYFDF